jgi:pre-mRNA-splicing factor SYF1
LHGFCTSALYLLYAKLEEEHGMARHAMAIYERATKAVLPEEMFEVRRIGHFTLL